MTAQELVKKYCNGTNDIDLFKVLVKAAGILDVYEDSSIEEDLEDFNLAELIDEFVKAADYKSISENDDEDVLSNIDSIQNDNYYNNRILTGVFWLDNMDCDFGEGAAKLIKPLLEIRKYISYEDCYFLDEETLASFKLREKYASEFSEGLDIYDFLEYLKDNGLDVYNDDVDICYEEKTVYVFIDNITTADEAEEILKKIKAKIDEYKK